MHRGSVTWSRFLVVVAALGCSDDDSSSEQASENSSNGGDAPSCDGAGCKAPASPPDADLGSCDHCDSSSTYPEASRDGGLSTPETPGVCAASGPLADVDMRCDCDAECVEGATCLRELETGAPGGRCTKICGQDAGADECGPRATCVQLSGGGPGYCVRKCAQNEDCAKGSICYGATHTCAPQCVSDAQCLSGRCDLYRGLCDDGQPSGTQGIYARCKQDSDCRSRFCNPGSGRCTTSCSVSQTQCPEQAVCVPDETSGDWGLCLPSCNADGSCEDRSLQCGAHGAALTKVCLYPSDSECLNAAAPHAYGADCRCASDCPGDSVCGTEATTSNPHGFCLKQCTKDNANCGTGFVCSSDGQGGGSCVAACQRDANCPGNDVCLFGQCLGICQSDDECFVGACNRYRGRCGLAVGTGRPMGAACIAGTQCISQQCVVLAGAGFCTALCSTVRQGCPDNNRCFDLNNLGGTVGQCVPPCDNNNPCPPALHCSTEPSATTHGYCIP